MEDGLRKFGIYLFKIIARNKKYNENGQAQLRNLLYIISKIVYMIFLRQTATKFITSLKPWQSFFNKSSICSYADVFLKAKIAIEFIFKK